MWNVNDYNDLELDEQENVDQEYHIPGLSDYVHEPNLEYKAPDKTPFILEYVRKNNREKKGVLLAVKLDDGKVVVGWSLCRSNDCFDKYFGQEIAFERGVKRFFDHNHFVDIPSSITPQIDRFISRCQKYFKDCDFPAWTI